MKRHRGPRALLVTAMVDCISQAHCSPVFHQLLDELSAFLSVVMGIQFRRPGQHRGWTWRLVAGQTECSVGQLRYVKVHPNTHPQEIRNTHLHAGELRGLELSRWSAMSGLRDPSFDASRSDLFSVAKSAIIEWLKRGGSFSMPPLKRRKTWRHWVRERALVIVPIGVAAGLLLGWILRAHWKG